MIGTVVSNKMKNAVVVSVETLKPHPLYHKRIKHTKRIKAQTTSELANGVLVRIEQIKPVSAQINFQVVEVLNKKEVKK
jgi:small subunit ribosomal protein S17